MENFTTQEHTQRNTEYDLTVNNPGKAIANLRADQKKKNLAAGITLAALALTVVVTGISLGATSADNTQLKAEVQRLTAENSALTQSMVNYAPQYRTVTDDVGDDYDQETDGNQSTYRHPRNPRTRSSTYRSTPNRATNTTRSGSNTTTTPSNRHRTDNVAARRRQHYAQAAAKTPNKVDTGRAPTPMPAAPAPTPVTSTAQQPVDQAALISALNAIPAYRNWMFQ